MSGQGDNNTSKKRNLPASDDDNGNSRDKRRGNDGNPKRQKTNRRRRPIDPSSLPRFLDSTGAVTAGTFAARRLPEMKSLWRSFLSTKHAKSDAVSFNVGSVDDAALYRSGGRKTSDRHLRRRTGSHSRRRRHRYPTGDMLSQTEDAVTDDEMSASEAKSAGVMTTNHKKSYQETKKPCRRARRKKGALREAHRHWQVTSSAHTTTLSSPPKQSDPSDTTALPSKWLETHLWHTKRFHMGNLFGWSVPLVHTGRGTAAGLRLAQTNCTVQDATWSIDGGAVVLCAPSLEALCVTLAKICGGQAEALQDKLVLSGMRWGEGTVHRPGAHPLGVIGPARFLFYRQKKNGSNGYHVAIFVHPAIRGKIHEALSSITNAGDCECSVDQILGGLALIQVRGAKAMHVISGALRPTALSSSTKDNIMSWDQVSQSSQAQTILPHGTIMAVEFSPKLSSSGTPQTGDSADVSKANQIEEDVARHIEEVNGLGLQGLVPNVSDIGSNNFAGLISHRPNNGASQGCHNTASCGWDILCSPMMANEIFLSLNNNGGACAIGLAEEGSAALEAEPTIAVFPRDFPDTETGEAYWSGHDNMWNIVRCCLEKGAQGGRFKTELKRTLKTQTADEYAGEHSYQSIDWNSVTECSAGTSLEMDTGVIDNDSNGSSGVEVVRGAFGAPFAQALEGSGSFPAKAKGNLSSNSDGKTRRPRRRVRPSCVAVNAEPLANEEIDTHENMCQMLLSSLSLPALLRCHISVEGKGNLMPGATIFEYNEEAAAQNRSPDVKLGYVVAGAYSSNRGKCHGPGFLGAAKLLRSLIENEHANTVSVMNQGEGGHRSVALRVLIRNAAGGSAIRSATLQLML